MRRMFATLAATLLIGAAQPGVSVVRVDPLTLADDDFGRHRDAATWRGLTVERITFTEERARWRLWRIVDPSRPTGPLWFVPHDDENAGFEAALVAQRKYGGTIVAADAGIVPGRDGQRTNAAVDFGRPIDPNRNFSDGKPLYGRVILEPLAAGAWPMIALHTNGAGYDKAESTCARPEDPDGGGVISAYMCNDTYAPSPSKARAWPFDDPDNVAIAAYLASKGRASAFCGETLAAADYNVMFEKVANTDGSMSNHAVLHGIDYLNFETLETGLEPSALAKARDRLVAMVDGAMKLCRR
jgi:hypothetical protein